MSEEHCSNSKDDGKEDVVVEAREVGDAREILPDVELVRHRSQHQQVRQSETTLVAWNIGQLTTVTINQNVNGVPGNAKRAVSLRSHLLIVVPSSIFSDLHIFSYSRLFLQLSHFSNLRIFSDLRVFS